MKTETKHTVDLNLDTGDLVITYPDGHATKLKVKTTVHISWWPVIGSVVLAFAAFLLANLTVAIFVWRNLELHKNTTNILLDMGASSFIAGVVSTLLVIHISER